MTRRQQGKLECSRATLDFLASAHQTSHMNMHQMVGKRVKEARLRAGLSQEELGLAVERLMGQRWTNKVVSFLEHGDRQLDSSELLIVAAVLGVPIHELMRPEPGEQIELPSGDWMDAAEISRHVFGDPQTDPRLATVAGRMRGLADVAEELAKEARGTSEILTGGAFGRFTRETSSGSPRPAGTQPPSSSTDEEVDSRIQVTEVPAAEAVSWLAEHIDSGGERVEETREESRKES